MFMIQKVDRLWWPSCCVLSIRSCDILPTDKQLINKIQIKMCRAQSTLFKITFNFHIKLHICNIDKVITIFLCRLAVVTVLNLVDSKNKSVVDIELLITF